MLWAGVCSEKSTDTRWTGTSRYKSKEQNPDLGAGSKFPGSLWRRERASNCSATTNSLSAENPPLRSSSRCSRPQLPAASAIAPSPCFNSASDVSSLGGSRAPSSSPSNASHRLPSILQSYRHQQRLESPNRLLRACRRVESLALSPRGIPLLPSQRPLNRQVPVNRGEQWMERKARRETLHRIESPASA